MNRTRRLVARLGVALMVPTVVLAIIAIWTYGPNSGRLAGTAAVLFTVGCLLLLGAVLD